MQKFFVPFQEEKDGIVKKLILSLGSEIQNEVKVKQGSNHPQSQYLNSTILFFPNNVSSFCTNSVQNSFIDISFETSFIAITHYMFRFPSNLNRLRFWSLYGSNDSLKWYEIDTREINRMPDEFEIQYFQTKTIGYFSRFRIMQTGANWANELYMCMDQFDLYGFFNIDPYNSGINNGRPTSKELSNSKFLAAIVLALS